MKEVVHFNTQKERLAYLRGDFEEIVPIEIKEEPKKAKNSDSDAENEKKSQNKKKKSTKKQKKGEDNGEILAE